LDTVEEQKKDLPSLNKITKALEEFYGIKEDQNALLRELRGMKIGKNERIKNFNIK